MQIKWIWWGTKRGDKGTVVALVGASAYPYRGYFFVFSKAKILNVLAFPYKIKLNEKASQFFKFLY